MLSLLRNLILTALGLAALLAADRVFGTWVAFGLVGAGFLAYIGIITWRQMKAGNGRGDDGRQ